MGKEVKKERNRLEGKKGTRKRRNKYKNEGRKLVRKE